MKKIAVIGSASMDFVVSTPKNPHPGETVIGHTLTTVPGGKGANQAVAASRLGAKVYMIGCVGEDLYGQHIIDNFRVNHVCTDHVQQVKNASTGTAHITVEPDGTNYIIIVQGANLHVTPGYIENARQLIEEVDFVLIQHEIAEEAVKFAIQLCYHLSTPIILDPAPARPVSISLLERVSYLTPNEQEASFLSDGGDVLKLLTTYPCKAILTAGAQGASYWDGIRQRHIPTTSLMNVTDTTGAGDTFNGALAVALAEGRSLDGSIRFANAAAALSVTQLGAQRGIPTKLQVEKFLAQTTPEI